MKFQAPKDVTGGIDIGGEFFKIDNSGVLEVPDNGDYARLLPPGFQAIPPEKADPVDHVERDEQ